jgi:uncharacterized membrane protein YphA (DoxX/SURF4 family)
MIQRLKSITDKGLSIFFARWLLGLLFLVRGWYKVFEMTPQVHTDRFFVERFAETWIWEPILWIFGMSIPFIELIGGALLCIGLLVRPVLAVLVGLLIILTYGHVLLEPFFDIDGHTFTYAVLIIFLLMVGRDQDSWSLENWMARSKSG